MRRAMALLAMNIISGCSLGSPTPSRSSDDQSVVADSAALPNATVPESSAESSDESSSAPNDFPVERHGAKLGDLRSSDWVADNGFRELTNPYPINLSYFLDHANLVTVVKRPINERGSGLNAFRDSFVGRILETDQVSIAAGRPYKVYTYEFDCEARTMTLLSTSKGVFGQSDPNGRPQSIALVPPAQETPVVMPSAQWNELCQTNHGVPFRPAMQ